MKKYIIFFFVSILTSYGIFALLYATSYPENFWFLSITGGLSIISVNVLIAWSAKSNRKN